MAVIKSGDSTDQLKIDSNSKAARVTMYRSDGTEVLDHVPVAISVNDVTVVDNDLVASFDASEYSYISFQLKGTWVGTVSFQASNDNGTFKDVVVQNVGDIVEPYKIEATTNSLVKIPVLAKYLRIRVTSYTSGIIEGVSFAYEHDVHTGQISSTGEVTFASGQTVAEVTNVQKMGGQDVSMGVGNVDSGTQRVTIGSDDPVSIASGTNVIGKVAVVADPTVTLLTDFYAALAGAVNVNSRVIRGQACILYTIVMTNYAATARHVKIYDTAVTPVAGVGTPIIVLSMPAGGTIGYPLPASGLKFSNGFSMTMVQGAANNNAVGTATFPDISLTSIFT